MSHPLSPFFSWGCQFQGSLGEEIPWRGGHGSWAEDSGVPNPQCLLPNPQEAGSAGKPLSSGPAQQSGRRGVGLGCWSGCSSRSPRWRVTEWGITGALTCQSLALKINTPSINLTAEHLEGQSKNPKAVWTEEGCSSSHCLESLEEVQV